MQINVVHNAKRNIAAGTINKIIILLCPFIERVFINSILGPEYLGLGSLYSAIISVLSLSELGFHSAMVFNMYKPAAEGDTKKINGLLNYYRNVYRVVGCIILLLGLLLIPFLPKMIKGAYPKDISLTKLYLIFLINSAISYFLYAYLTSIIVVHQRDDINSTINSFVKIGLTIAQIAVLVTTKNYYLFSLVMLLFTIIGNLLRGWRVRKLFPQYRPEGNITKSDKDSIRKVVIGTFIQRACAVTRNSLDSICISAFLGLTLTAIYNNYYLLITGVTSFVSLITASFTGGVGNHVAVKSPEENYLEMKTLDFVYLWISGWCMICLLCLYQPFMLLWMGEKMTLPFSSVVLFCLYFYMLKLGDVRSLYSSANGLWWEQRFRSISETALNLVLNIVLGKYFGIKGIISATMISLFLCNYLWAVEIVFRLYFSMTRIRDYYSYQGKHTFITIVIAAVTYGICSVIPIVDSFLQITVRAIVCMIVPNLLYFVIYKDNEKFLLFKEKIMK